MRVLLTIILALGLVIPLGADTFDDLFVSIRPLQFMKNGTNRAETVCTVFSVGEGKWVGVNHCWVDGGVMLIGGVIATVVKRDPERDLIMFDGVKVPGLKVGDEPKFRDSLYMIGFPYASIRPMGMDGVVSIPSTTLYQGRGLPASVMASTVHGVAGMSGAPLFDKDNEVVSVHHGGWAIAPHPLAPRASVGLSSTWVALKGFVQT